MIKRHDEHLLISHVAWLVGMGLLISMMCFWCAMDSKTSPDTQTGRVALLSY